MLDALRFVKGAVAKKDFCPVLTHFRIEGGRITGSDGDLALSSPIPIDLSATPKAATFATAIANCEAEVQIVQLPSSSLSIRSGSFRAVIECSTDEFPSIPIGGKHLRFDFEILPVLRILDRYISEDASRPWSQGVLFRGKSAYALNNIILAQYWIGVDTPVEINIPTKTITEMLRIGEEPEYFEVTDTTVTVRYSGDRWLFSRTIGEEWPNIGRYLNETFEAKPIPAELFKVLPRLRPFLTKEGSVYLGNGAVRTLADEDQGAQIAVEGLEADGKFSLAQLMLLEGVAETIDFSKKPCGWYGKNIRGVIYGMRT